jgi:hypothetical protein
MKLNRILALMMLRRFVHGAACAMALAAVFGTSIPALATSPGTNGKIAFLQGHSIFTVNPDGSNQTMVAAPPANLFYQDPAWSPDGNRIAFISSNSAGASSLNVINGDGTNLSSLTSSPDVFQHPTWSPDGSQIAFAVSSSVDTSIWVINGDGSNLHNLIPATTSQPAWSPDGKKIAVVVGGPASHNIWLKNADGTGSLAQLTSGTQDDSPTWSPDGTQIAFSLSRQIYRIKVDGTGLTKLSNGADNDSHPSWSPDSTRIAFQTSTSSVDIWTMSTVDGSGRAELTSCDCATSADWQPLQVGSLPLLSINDVRVLDGNFATTNATFIVSLSTASNQVVTVNFATANGTAISGRDYQANSGALVFAPGEASKQVTVLIYGNALPEPDKAFFVNLSNPVNAVIARGQGTGTILNANTALTINDVTVTRSNSGTTAALFTVSLSPPANFPVTVEFATANGSATSPLDYVAQSGRLTFAPLETSKQISIVVNAETANLPPQTYFVNLSNPTNAILAKAAGVGTIVNPDFPPVTPGPQFLVAAVPNRFTNFTAALASQAMGMNEAGTFVIAFVVPGSDPANCPRVTCAATAIFARRYAADATPQGDAFRVDDPALTIFASPELGQPAVAVDADGSFVVAWTEGVFNGTFFDFSKIHGQRYNANGTPLGPNFLVSVTTGTTDEHDEAPSVAMSGVGSGPGDFVVTWQGYGVGGTDIFARLFDSTGAPRGDKFLVNSFTAGRQLNPAVAANGFDFVIVWDGAGSDDTAGIFARRFSDNGVPLGDQFRVNPFTDTAKEHPAVGMDAAGNFVSVWHSFGATPGVFARRFGLFGPLGSEFQLDTTAASSNISRHAVGVGANGDFVVAWDGISVVNPQAVFARLYDASGAAQGTAFQVSGLSNSFFSAARMDRQGNFVVSWEADLAATFSGILARRFVVPRRPPPFPSLRIGNASVTKPASGAANAAFTVTLSPASTQTVTVHFETADFTASARTDYQATSGTLTFAPGETTKQIVVQVFGGRPNSSDEAFFVNLSNPTNAPILRLRGTGTILAPRSIAYTISAAPASLGLLPSSSKTSAITLRSQNGVSEGVQLTADWMGTAPTDATIALSSTQVSVPSAGDSVPATLSVTTLSSASIGTFTLRISGTSASGVARFVDLTIVITPNLPAPACGCTKVGPFVDPRVKALVQPDPQTGIGPNGLATVSGSGFITVTRNSDGRTVVPATSNVSAFGFSPNGKFFVLITKQDSLTGPTFSATLYSVEKPGLVGPSSPLVTNALSWGFSPDSDNQFFLVTSSDNVTTHVDVAVYDTGSGTRVMFEPAALNPAFGTAPAWEDEKDVEDNDTDDDSKNDDKNIGGWGFSPDGKTFLLSFKTGQNEAFVGLWSLTHNTNFQVFSVTAHDVAGFWQFSPCGDLFMWVHQAGGNPSTSDFVDFLFTSTGRRYQQANLAPSQPPSATVFSATVTPDSKQILLKGMSPSSIPIPQCNILPSLHSPANILLTDDQGRSTGFDPGTGGVLNQIPGGSYTGVGSEPQTISVPYVAGGYLLDAFGLSSLTSPQPYRLTIAITDGSGDVVSQRDFSAMASPGSKDRYGFTVERSTSSSLNRILVPPLIEAAVSGTLGNNGWYVSDVGVSWNVTPLSDITSMSGCQPLTVTSDTLGATFTCTATNADGTTSKSVTIKRNATPPAITVLRTPPPNANGWNNTDVTVSFTASALSGIASVSGPVTLTSEGANQMVTGTATSLAGISASVTVTVNIDKTPPEAFAQFGPTQQDLQVFGRDALSGISADPFPPISVVRVSANPHDGEHRGDADDGDHHGKDDNADEDEGAELRTYRLEDLAGNSVVLVELVRKEDHEIKARVFSTQYNDGPVLAAPRNTMNFEWSFGEDGGLKELQQKLAVGAGTTRQEIEAKFHERKNQTAIEQEEPKPEQQFVKPGVVLLRMSTDKGNLVLEF